MMFFASHIEWLAGKMMMMSARIDPNSAIPDFPTNNNPGNKLFKADQPGFFGGEISRNQ